jgi:hypothetical protein
MGFGVTKRIILALFSGPFPEGLELLDVLNLGQPDLLSPQDFAGALSRFRREGSRRASQRFWNFEKAPAA